MTGHWQILGSARIPMEEMVGIDYLYVANWSLWTDVKILLRTVPYMFVAPPPPPAPCRRARAILARRPRADCGVFLCRPPPPFSPTLGAPPWPAETSGSP